jgi:ABC-type dipeptide/oligopeptide/nickel transport system permease subunit
MANEKGQSLWGDAWLRLKGNRMAMICLGLVLFFTALAVYGEVAYRYYDAMDITPAYQKTNLDIAYQAPNLNHWMGTDGLGRDVMLRLVQGVRIAFMVGIITSLIAIPIGVFLGCLAGYYGGRVDDFIVWL